MIQARPLPAAIRSPLSHPMHRLALDWNHRLRQIAGTAEYRDLAEFHRQEPASPWALPAAAVAPYDEACDRADECVTSVSAAVARLCSDILARAEALDEDVYQVRSLVAAAVARALPAYGVELARTSLVARLTLEGSDR